MKQTAKNKRKKEDHKETPICSKCKRKMELVDVVPSDGGRSLTVRHKCPKCVNMWNIRSLMAVSQKASDPKYSDMYK